MGIIEILVSCNISDVEQKLIYFNVTCDLWRELKNKAQERERESLHVIVFPHLKK